jgi:hypothetical protein
VVFFVGIFIPIVVVVNVVGLRRSKHHSKFILVPISDFASTISDLASRLDYVRSGPLL